MILGRVEDLEDRQGQLLHVGLREEKLLDVGVAMKKQVEEESGLAVVRRGTQRLGQGRIEVGIIEGADIKGQQTKGLDAKGKRQMVRGKEQEAKSKM